MKDTKKVAKLNYLAPAILMVVSRVPYMIIQKVTPETIDPYVSLCLCYGVCLIVVIGMFFLTKKGQNFMLELKKINWTAPALGICLVCMDVSVLLMFRMGWNLSVGSVLLYVLLAIALVIVGAIFYKEKVTLKRLVGIIMCIVGVILISEI